MARHHGRLFLLINYVDYLTAHLRDQ
jgi:hypothetical protein